MSFTFLDINPEFDKCVKKRIPLKCHTHTGGVNGYKPTGKKVYYVSPANSLGMMDGGIDEIYSRKMFPGLENKVKEAINKAGKLNGRGHKYLPVGSALTVPTGVDNNYMIVAPTMLMPENVKDTRNAMWSMSAVLHVLAGQNFFDSEDEVIIPGLCTGVGGMDFDTCCQQMALAVYPFMNNPNNYYDKDYYVCEPNLQEQPIYKRTGW
jgi:O-acetyl-ADP-ribose deacetylase (regulator of RNase III)